MAGATAWDPHLAQDLVDTIDPHIIPEVTANEPSLELLTRSIVAILLNGPPNENGEVIDAAGRYLEYSVLLVNQWEQHQLLKDFTVDLTTIDSRAR